MIIFAAVIQTEVVETRGRPAKYDFDIKVGDTLTYPEKEKTRIRSAFNAYLFRNNLKWKIKTWVANEIIFLQRTK